MFTEFSVIFSDYELGSVMLAQLPNCLRDAPKPDHNKPFVYVSATHHTSTLRHRTLTTAKRVQPSLICRFASAAHTFITSMTTTKSSSAMTDSRKQHTLVES